MSVSAPAQVPQNPDEDLAAIVAGGKHFTARLKAIKDARLEHDEALGKLRLGHDVVRAMQDVQSREQAVMDAVAVAKEKKSGGAVMKNVGGSVPGKKAGGRIGKARGGSCDASPYSSAHRG